MAILENATIAMTYAKQFREQAAHLARQRTTTIDWVQFLAEEDDVLKKNVLRELGHTTPTIKNVAKNPPRTKGADRPADRRNHKGDKGKERKGAGKKGRPDWAGDWRGKSWAQNGWTSNSWGAHNVRQNDQQLNQQQTTQAPQPDQAANAKAKASNR